MWRFPSKLRLWVALICGCTPNLWGNAQFNDVTRNIVVAMPGVAVFSRENYGSKEPRTPSGGWTQYLRSMRQGKDGANPLSAGFQLEVDAPQLLMPKDRPPPSSPSKTPSPNPTGHEKTPSS